MSARLRRWCDMLIEGGWLLAVVLVTLYFNIYTKDSRIFEPQKALLLRFLVTMMLAIWAVRVLEENRERLQEMGWWRTALWVVALVSAVLAIALFVVQQVVWQDPLEGMAGAEPISDAARILTGLVEAGGTFVVLFGAGLALVGAGYALRDSWKAALQTAMVIPALAYVAVHLISTIGSVFPQASLYGGYVRQQGTLTVLAYIGLFLVIAFNLRRREQLERLITVILVTSVPSALYGIVQKFGIDPLPWMGNVEARVASTMGNAIFIAAYLIMILPLTGYRLLSTWEKLRASPPPAETPARGNNRVSPFYAALLWGAVGLILFLVLVVTPVVLSANVRAMEQNPAVKVEEIAQVWPSYGKNLLLFAAVAVLSVALPAFLYTVLTLIRERWRPYAYLAGLGAVVLEVAVVMVGMIVLPEGNAAREFLQDLLTSGYFWAGYLIGLCLLALLSRWQHVRFPWGGDALWVNAAYILLVAQGLALFLVIQAYLPNSPEPGRVSVAVVAFVLILLFGFFVITRQIGGRTGFALQLLGFLGIALFLVIQATLPAPSTTEGLAPIKWPLYLFALLPFFSSCYLIASARIEGRVGYLAQLGGYALLVLLQLVCVFLTQSRGPLLGLLVSAFVFALLWPLRRGIRWAVVTVLVVAVVGFVGLAIFNLPETPLLGDLVMRNPQFASFVEQQIQPLRNIPYIGRLGRIFDASSGTGRVRILIWFGDEIGQGSVGMIAHNPLRTLIGYGPESMHVAYNPYYPPELAHVERRNASPDRAHNAIIDELVTLGALGLVAYLFYFLCFFVLVGQLLWKAPDKHNQALGVALFTLGVAHFAETLFGIPIVATRMYMWIAIGAAVALTSMWPFRGEEPEVAAEVDEQQVEEHDAVDRRRRRRSGRRRARHAGIPVGWGLAYAAVLLAAFFLSNRVNLKSMQADLLFWKSKQMAVQAEAVQKQAQTVADEAMKQTILQRANDFAEVGLLSLHQAIYLIPQEDFFFLSLAQAYLSAANLADAQQQKLFLDSTERAILEARDLSPLNTDHYRNLAVLFLNWFQNTKEPERLVRAIAYNEQAISLTGNNADLRNRLAQAYLIALLPPYGSLAAQEAVQPKALAWLRDWDSNHLTSGGREGDTHLPLTLQYRQQALEYLGAGDAQRGLMALAAAELQYSLFLDERYADTYQLLGDLYMQLGMPAEAARTFATGVELSLRLISDAQLETRLRFLAQDHQLGPLVQAYQNVIERVEDSLGRTGAAAAVSRLHRDASDAYQVVAYCHILQGDRPAAIQAYESALAHQDTYEAHKNLAILYDQVGQAGQALVQAQMALEIAKKNNQAKDVEELEQYIQQIQARQQQGTP